MKKVLIIMGNHSPEPSSVANVMDPLIKELNQKYSIDIITNRERVFHDKHVQEKNLNIYRIDDYRSMNTKHVNSLLQIESAKYLRFITKIIGFFLRVLYYFHYSFFAKERVVSAWEEERVLHKIIELDNIYDYEVMISVSLPFQGHFIAERFKEYKGNKLKWLVFEFDPYTFNYQINKNKLRRKSMYRDEKRIFNKCDKIILTPELYGYYKEKELFEISSKFISLPYATLKEIKKNNQGNVNLLPKNKINCLFTGNLYSDIRSPEKLLLLFSKLDKDCKLTLMTNFSSENIKKLSPNGYLPHIIPFQKRNVALFNMLNANILINIGNTVEHQVPGKIFEYISTGKPIIHFSKIKNDPALKYLENYPLVLIIKEWDFDKEKEISKIKEFCLNNYNKTISYKNISVNMGEYSSEVVKNKFVAIIDELFI